MRMRSIAGVVLLGLFAAAPAMAQERIGAGLDLWGETSRMSGEQFINQSRINESFDYGAIGGSVTLWMLFNARERVRAGPGVRIYGNYGETRDNGFNFGFLTEAFLLAEYSLPAFEKFDAIFGGRVGAAVLFPGGHLQDEIRRLQAEGVGVWSLPRPGWLAGIDLGVRRRMTERLWLRTDIHGQYEQIFLFGTDEIVDDLRFRKAWSTHSVRVGLLVGAEFAL